MKRLIFTLSLLFCSFCILSAQNVGQINAEVYFATDKYDLKGDSRAILSSLKDNLVQYTTYSIFVKGNTDADGNNTYNQQLSEKRVASVKAQLIKLGVPADAFNIVAVGEEEPVADNHSNEGKQKNRRVDIIVHYTIGTATPVVTQAPEITPLSIDALFSKLGLQAQTFVLKNDRDTSIYCTNGTLIIIPAGSFDAPKGVDIHFKVKEILNKTDMLLENLTTTAQNKLLNSGGMLHLSATTSDGKTVELKDNKSLAVKIPTTQYEPQMQYFYGMEQPKNTNSVDWNLMAGAAVNIDSKNNMIGRNSFVFGGMPQDDEGVKMSPVENDRLARYVYNNGDKVGFMHFYQLEDNYYKILYKALIRDTCRALYAVKTIEKTDSIRQIHTKKGIASFFKRLFTGEPATYVTTKAVKRTIKQYSLQAGLPADCQKLALYGKENNLERMGWAAIHRSKHEDLYDVLETSLQVKGYDAIMQKLEQRVPYYDARLADFKVKYRVKVDSFNKVHAARFRIWQEKYDRWQKKQAELVEARLTNGKISRDDINYYFFQTNRLGWLNCDYFSNNDKPVAVTTPLKKAGNLDVKLVFKDRMAAMGANNEDNTICFNNVPSGKKAWIVAMQFFTDGPSLAIQEIETGKDVPAFTFQKMSIAEMRTALGKLNE